MCVCVCVRKERERDKDMEEGRQLLCRSVQGWPVNEEYINNFNKSKMFVVLIVLFNCSNLN